MNKKLSDLSQNGRKELALAIHLWKDFKCQGKLNVDIMKQSIELAKMLGIYKEFDEKHTKLPPFDIKERFKN